MKKTNILFLIIMLIIYSAFVIVLTSYFTNKDSNPSIETTLQIDKNQGYSSDLVETSLLFYDKKNTYSIIAEYANGSNSFNIESILKSNIINDHDKELLNEDVKKAKKIMDLTTQTTRLNYHIYFINDNGEDIIYINKCGITINEEYYKSLGLEKRFIFKSNLNYSFEEIIKKFNDLYNLNLEIGNLTLNKIKIDFIKNNDGIYIPAYYCCDEGKLYVLNMG